MRVLTVQIGSVTGWNDEAPMKEEKLAAARAKLIGVGLNMEGYDKIEYEKFIVTETQLVDIMMRGIDCTVVNSTNIGDEGRALDALNAIVGKLEAFAGSVSNAQFNEKVEVYTPGMGLMLFNRVMLLEDACSDALQTELDNGWKIIAACPQPNQRRPDYILGRYDPTHADNAGAANRALRG